MRTIEQGMNKLNSFPSPRVTSYSVGRFKIKINVYAKRQTSDSSWEFLRIENKEMKTIQNNSYV